MCDHVTFRLNDAVQVLRDVSPTLMLLELLRKHRLLMGTKEGYADDDFGVCNVAVRELVDSKLFYQAINTCIQTVRGRQ